MLGCGVGAKHFHTHVHVIQQPFAQGKSWDKSLQVYILLFAIAVKHALQQPLYFPRSVNVCAIFSSTRNHRYSTEYRACEYLHNEKPLWFHVQFYEEKIQEASPSSKEAGEIKAKDYIVLNFHYRRQLSSQ